MLVQAAAALERLAADMDDDDEIVGVNVVRKALSSPLFWIAANAGEDGSVVVSKVSEMGARDGFNAATGEYGDLLSAGIIDPVKVTSSAVVNACSVARMVLTTETAIVEKPAEPDAAAGHGHHGHAH